MKEKKEYMSIKETCKEMQIGRATLYRYIKKGLPTVEYQRHTYINKEEYEQWRSTQKMRNNKKVPARIML